MGQRVEIASSIKEFTLVMGGAECDVRFSPTDAFFVERLFGVFEALGAKQEEHDNQAEQAAGKKEIFAVSRARDAEMREMINGMFDQDVCSVLISGRNVYSMADGLPEWCNLLLALMDLVDSNLAAEQKASSPRVQHYADKYKKYQQFKR